MSQEKIVVILLLITIILSIVSVIITMSIDTSARIREIQTTKIVSGDRDSAGNILLEIKKSTGGTP